MVNAREIFEPLSSISISAVAVAATRCLRVTALRRLKIPFGVGRRLTGRVWDFIMVSGAGERDHGKYFRVARNR